MSIRLCPTLLLTLIALSFPRLREDVMSHADLIFKPGWHKRLDATYFKAERCPMC